MVTVTSNPRRITTIMTSQPFLRLLSVPFLISLLLLQTAISAPSASPPPSPSTFAPSPVPGCPDLASLDKLELPSGGSLDELLLCFCQRRFPHVSSGSPVAISCLYGSTLEHLERAAGAVQAANLTVDQLSIQHMEFPQEGINATLLSSLVPGLARLDIRECSGSNGLRLDDDAFVGLEDSLVNITIHDCKLKEVPGALDRLGHLRTLVLSSNDIESLNKSSFAGKKELRYLDLSGNMINDVEEETFGDLQDLETLLMGDHNYVKDTLLSEIGRLTSLEFLDLSRADGIFEPPEGIFPNLPMLKTLKLAGCSIAALEPGAFAPLGQLEQLDLRVNLIENISALAFDGLTSLKRLALAGNYIRTVESDHWAGLAALEELDLGWNELKQFEADSFAAVAPSLAQLDLRHNPITKIPPISLPELRVINLSETNITEIGRNAFEQLPKLETVEFARCNISDISPDAFAPQKATLKGITLNGNRLRDIPLRMEDLPLLEEISVASNPLLCDDKLGKFIASVKAAYQLAAQEGRAFLLSNANDTVCSRPWSLRGQSVFELSDDQLKPYDEAADTTTAPTTTAASVMEDTTTLAQPTLPPFTLPDLTVGKKTNESIFSDEREREQYDLSKTDESKNPAPNESNSTAVLISVSVFGLMSLIAVIAIIHFIKKNRQVSPTKQYNRDGGSVKKNKIEDEMVEIELESGPPSTRQYGGAGGGGGRG